QIWVRVPAGGPISEGVVSSPVARKSLTGTSDTLDNSNLVAAYGLPLGFLLTNPLNVGGPQAERPTLLLVESDELTRDAMTVMLHQEGYQVLAVATGRDAWNVLRAPFSPIDMVLLDVHLPDISGVQLVQRLRDTYPRLPVFAWMHGSEPTQTAQLVKLGVHH